MLTARHRRVGRTRGWRGRYGGTFKVGFDGDINGIVFQLDNKHCRRTGTKKTERTALFIHSEMLPNGKQNPGFEPERWDGASDYLSKGCIKLKPSDIRKAAKRYREYYGGSADEYKNKLLIVRNR